MRKLATVVTLSAAAAFGAVLLASSASAGSVDATAHTGYIKRATTSYMAPSNQSTPVHFNLVPGQPANVLCFTEGQSINGNHTWIRIGQDGKLGFVHRDTIAPGASAPHC